MKEQWRGFTGTHWVDDVNVRDFIQHNYTPYDGDESFLAEPTAATNTLWGKLQELQHQERAKGGVLDMETEIIKMKGPIAKCMGRSYVDGKLCTEAVMTVAVK